MNMKVKIELCFLFGDIIFRLDQQNSQLNPLSFFPDNTKREFHQRSAFPSSNTSQTRQQIIDLLRKAYNQGWKPNLKHYIPGTRFGRHNR